MELPEAVLAHLVGDRVAWLTTITDSGAPSPTPVWFLWNPVGHAVVFCEPVARKAANIAARPTVTLHFNCDAEGSDIAVLRCHATITEHASMADDPAYFAKYPDAREYGDTATTKITLTPVSAWTG